MDPQHLDGARSPQVWPPLPHRPSGSHLTSFWMAASGLALAVAALSTSIVVLRQHVPEPPWATSKVAIPTATPGRTAASDRALCSDIAPLMAEDDRVSNAWRNTGDPGTLQRDSALSKYRLDTEDWAQRIQSALGKHDDADPFLRRTLQRFIDDRVLFVRNARPGLPEDYDNEIWADSLSAYGGPLSTCDGLGVKW